eukprot:COSAG04_NODE_31597_length_256_cov_0.579618_1_plen_47_part_01
MRREMERREAAGCGAHNDAPHPRPTRTTPALYGWCVPGMGGRRWADE